MGCKCQFVERQRDWEFHPLAAINGQQSTYQLPPRCNVKLDQQVIQDRRERFQGVERNIEVLRCPVLGPEQQHLRVEQARWLPASRVRVRGYLLAIQPDVRALLHEHRERINVRGEVQIDADGDTYRRRTARPRSTARTNPPSVSL